MGLLSRLRDLLAPPAPVPQPQAEPDSRPLAAPWGPIEVPAGAIRDVRVQMQLPFQGTRLVFGEDEEVRTRLVLAEVIVGRTVQRFPEMTPLRGRTDMEILWDAAEPTEVITLRVRNVSAEPAMFSGTIFGRRPTPVSAVSEPPGTGDLLRALLHNLVQRTVPPTPPATEAAPSDLGMGMGGPFGMPTGPYGMPPDNLLRMLAQRNARQALGMPESGDSLVGVVSRLTSAFSGALLREIRVAIGLSPTAQSHRNTRTLVMPFPETHIPYGASRDVVVLPQARFRCDRLVLAEDIASHVVIDDIRIGTVSQFAAIGPLDGSTFSPDAVGTGVVFDTAEPGLTILLRVRSKGTMPELSGEAETNSGGLLFRASMLGTANP